MRKPSADEKLVYLFASAYHKLYKQDVMDVLALPKGFRHHFRYDEPWIATEILGGRYGIEGKRSIVVYVDRALPGEEEREPRFYPIRNATIINSKTEGSTIHVYFEIGTYIDYRTPQTSTEYDQTLKRTVNENNRPVLRVSDGNKGISGKFIGLGAPGNFHSSTEDKEGQAAGWQKIVKAIDSLKVFDNTVFFRLSEVEHVLRPGPVRIRFRFLKEFLKEWVGKELTFRESCRLAKTRANEHFERISPSSDFLPTQTGYILKGGELYMIVLSFYRSSPPSDEMQRAAVDIELDPGFFHTGMTRPITTDFRYDRRSFELATQTLLTSSVTKISVGLKKNGVLAAPRLIFPVYLLAPRSKLVLLLTLFLFGSGAVAVCSSGLILLDWLKRVLVVLGPLSQTLALWFIYRRLK